MLQLVRLAGASALMYNKKLPEWSTVGDDTWEIMIRVGRVMVMRRQLHRWQPSDEG